MPVEPLLGSKVLLAYLETTEGARLLSHIPPSWAGLHRDRVEASEAEKLIDCSHPTVRRNTKAPTAVAGVRREGKAPEDGEEHVRTVVSTSELDEVPNASRTKGVELATARRSIRVRPSVTLVPVADHRHRS